MRMPIAFLSLAVLLLAASPGRAAFLDGFEDVPAMPGLAVVKGAGVAFDTPSGRIVEAYAAGAVSGAAVRRFYQTALPQLGWTRVGELEFRREGERLTLELLGAAEAATVRFRLSPAAP